MAVTKTYGENPDGTLSECRAKPENRGKGRCHHHEHLKMSPRLAQQWMEANAAIRALPSDATREQREKAYSLRSAVYEDSEFKSFEHVLQPGDYPYDEIRKAYSEILKSHPEVEAFDDDGQFGWEDKSGDEKGLDVRLWTNDCLDFTDARDWAMHAEIPSADGSYRVSLRSRPFQDLDFNDVSAYDHVSDRVVEEYEKARRAIIEKRDDPNAVYEYGPVDGYASMTDDGVKLDLHGEPIYKVNRDWVDVGDGFHIRYYSDDGKIALEKGVYSVVSLDDSFEDFNARTALFLGQPVVPDVFNADDIPMLGSAIVDKYFPDASEDEKSRLGDRLGLSDNVSTDVDFGRNDDNADPWDYDFTSMRVESSKNYGNPAMTVKISNDRRSDDDDGSIEKSCYCIMKPANILKMSKTVGERARKTAEASLASDSKLGKSMFPKALEAFRLPADTSPEKYGRWLEAKTMKILSGGHSLKAGKDGAVLQLDKGLVGDKAKFSNENGVYGHFRVAEGAAEAL